jgi:hypothetical protein
MFRHDEPPEVVRERLDAWLLRCEGTSFDLVIAGRHFGGRAGESPQKLREACLDATSLIIRFEPTELLTVVRPRAVAIGRGGDLTVRDAAEVAFGWHFYGRGLSPESWCVQTCCFEDTMVLCTLTGPITAYLPAQERFARQGAAAMQLLRCG